MKYSLIYAVFDIRFLSLGKIYVNSGQGKSSKEINYLLRTLL